MTNQEINEAVARKLGWTLSGGLGWMSPPIYRKPDDVICQKPNPPDYAGSIQAAWEILEYLCKHGKPPIIWMCEDGEACISFKYDEMVTDILPVPLAICLAFLKLP
jgi:hypothetical protein